MDVWFLSNSFKFNEVIGLTWSRRKTTFKKNALCPDILQLILTTNIKYLLTSDLLKFSSEMLRRFAPSDETTELELRHQHLYHNIESMLLSSLLTICLMLQISLTLYPKTC